MMSRSLGGASQHSRFCLVRALLPPLPGSVCTLQTGLRTLPPTLSTLFGPEGSVVEAAVRETAKQSSSELRQRAAQELPLLPFSRCG